MIFSERPRFKTPHLGFSESLGRPLAPPSEWKRPGSLSAKHLLPPTCNSSTMLSTPDPSSWSPGLLDPPPETLDLSPMGSSRPGSRGSGALRRRSSGGGPQGGGGGDGVGSFWRKGAKMSGGTWRREMGIEPMRGGRGKRRPMRKANESEVRTVGRQKRVNQAG